MKNFTYIFLSLWCLACSKKQIPETKEPVKQAIVVPPTTKIQLLIVDYTTFNFEGGKEINLTKSVPTDDSIPISVNYKAPLDFGNIQIFHKLSNDLLFDGSIIWMGKGTIKFPTAFDTSTTFVRVNSALPEPDSSRFQIIHYDKFQSIQTSEVWQAISKLKVTEDYLQFNKHIGLFLYTPSVGIGNPLEWDWFVFLSN
jgi:hypothetical protein